MMDRLVWKHTPLDPLQQFYIERGVAEHHCPIHGVYHLARAIPSEPKCYYCAAEVADARPIWRQMYPPSGRL